MQATRAPRYPWGLNVRAVVDLHNDGSHPHAEPGAVLVCAGAGGEIANIGHHAEANVPVYLVDFAGTLVGCLEDEIEPAPRPRPAP